MIERYVLGLEEIDRTRAALVGGKGAGLGELSRIEGVHVPAGFCVTTDAFRRIMAAAPGIDDLLDQLSNLDPGSPGSPGAPGSPGGRQAVGGLCAEIRRAVEGVAVPGDLAEEIAGAVARLGGQEAYAVRSSATAEDLPTASFAGQQDTYLNVVGPAAILEHVSRCWASAFTERAVAYRVRGGFDHRKAAMAVVVQRMVSPRSSGVLFTADPVTSNRKVISVEAVSGLGEALVSGLATPDTYKVRDGEIVARTVAARRPVLTDAQITRLARLGRRIEEHFGHPQDIEWCLADGTDGDDGFRVVQSRPITTLFPVPATGEQGNRVYVSVGHQQMMTDPIKPLGISLWQLTALRRPMFEAGGRLFVDVTRDLGSPATREPLVKALGTSDPLIGDALRSVIDRGDFIPQLPESPEPPQPPPGSAPAPSSPPASPASLVRNAPADPDPAVVASLVAMYEASIDALKRDIRSKSGTELLDFIAADVQELKRVLRDPRSMQVIMAGMQAAGWLNEHLREWLGEKNAADALTQSAPGNVTAEMGLALLDVADAIRPHPQVVAFLERVESLETENLKNESLLDELPALAGGREARDAIAAYLDKYGMRCAGEIDVTRPRWSERPATLVPMILGNIRNFEAGEGARRFEQGRRNALDTERIALTRLRSQPDGDRKAEEAKRMIDRVRAFAGYREYPKYHIVSRYFVYKRALLEEAGRLAAARVLGDPEDIFYLTFGELREVVRVNKADGRLIRERRAAFASQAALTPPRVLTSDGEAVAGAYRRDGVPAGALVGLPVSAGTAEGRARVVPDMARADLEAGDILVTAYTDPSWTPAFVAIGGLVTEVGGLMTHGAVIAREYGLPAVVGVEHATRLITDGQRIRVHGTDGYVEILDEAG